MWNFFTFGVNDSNDNSNSSVQQQIPIKYSIIGNGRLFYFIPTLTTYTIPTKTYIFAFGKVKTIVDNNLTKNYILVAYPQNLDKSCFSYYRMRSASAILPLTNINNISYSSTYTNNWYGLLSYKGVTDIFKCYGNMVNNYSSTVLISGNIGNYPSKIDNRYYISKTKMYINNDYYGDLSGLMWTYNSQQILFYNQSIIKSKYKNKDKYLFVYNEDMCVDTNMNFYSGTTSKFIYNISLDYEDWGNYE